MYLGKKVTIIAAMARNGAIGADGNLPWHLPGELRHFKETTMGKAIVMGRKTWESIGRPLPGRQNIIVTRNTGFRVSGCDVATSLDEAVELAAGEEVIVIGGGQLYAQSLAFSDRLVLTTVDFEPVADTWFPAWQKQDWQQISRRSVEADVLNPYAYEVVEWIRKENACDTCPEPGKPAGPPA